MTGAAPRARSTSMMRAVWSIHFCMKRDQSSDASRNWWTWPRRRRGIRRWWAPKRLEEEVDAGAPERRVGPSGGLPRAPSQCGVGLDDDAFDQRQQHRILGREIEVERRTGDSGALGQVVDGDLGQRAFVEQPCRGLQDRQLTVVTRRTGRAAAPGGARLGWRWSRRQTLHACRISQHTVDSLDTVLITLHHDRICRRRHRGSRHLRHQRRLAPAGPLP